MRDFTHFLFLLFLRCKGIKKEFRKDPLNYQKFRKGDIHNPTRKSFRSKSFIQFKINSTLVTEVSSNTSNCLFIYCHGGAFVYGPSKHHWDFISKITAQSNCTAWMIDYPKAPEHRIRTLSENIDRVYEKALSIFKNEKIILCGDSVGGTLLLSLSQRLVKENKKLPGKLILISPVMDASFSNSGISYLEQKDPILSKNGVLSAKKMCVGSGSLYDPLISPIYGDFLGLPPITIYLAENDITFPDQILAVKKMKEAKVTVYEKIGKQMPHIWPILPFLKQGKIAQNEIIQEVHNFSTLANFRGSK